MFPRIAIIGLGLLGGSFALAVKKRFPGTHITAIGRDALKLAPAQACGMVDAVSTSRTEGVAGSSLIIIGTPAASVVPVLAEIAPFISPGTLITDVASTKQEIVRAADGIDIPNAMFIGCHPIAGSEKTGYDNASVSLYEGKTVVVTPGRTTKTEATALLTALWKDLSAVPVVMDAAEHDKKLAVTSHLVHLMSGALAATVSREDTFMPLIGSGFLDTTRIAKGDETMWTDIVKTNSSDILSALSRFKNEVNEIERMINARDYQALFSYLKRVREFQGTAMTDIVTLDGPAGAGKSTVAKRLARVLGFEYLDTGATYRCVTLYFIRNNVPLQSPSIPAVMKKIDIRFEGSRVFLNGDEVTNEIRMKAVNDLVSPVSTIPTVREAMVDVQRRIAQSGKYVVDGRDIGTVVFPDARFKFYIDASADERARRRHEEEKAKGIASTFEDVKKNVMERDAIDSGRAHSPLRKAADAYNVDTTGMSIDEVVETVRAVINEKRDGTMERDEEKREITAEELEFRKALEGGAESPKVDHGEIVTSRVIQIDDTHVYVSLGAKSEGKIKLEEFRTLPAIGDSVEVQLLSRENNAGEAVVSKLAADRVRSRDAVEAAWKNGANVKGVVTAAVKGGFRVSVGGLDAFCPRSLIDIRRNIEEKDYVDQEYDFRIIEKQGRDLVVSRRKVLDEIAEYTIGNFFEHLAVGDVIRGKVKNIESFGIFVEVAAGLDGFLAFSNIAWDKVKEPTKALKKGEERDFKVLSLDREKRKLDLGLKQLSDDPWHDFVASHKVEDVVKGEVTSIKDFGAFIRVHTGVEGLAHISELSWAKHVNHPKDVVKTGDFVECMILGIDNENRKLSLGLKQVKTNPWESAARDFPVGSTIECMVKKILKNYAVLGMNDDIEGTIDVSDFDWKNPLVNIDNYLKEGEKATVKVVSVDGALRKIKLSVKHLAANPWTAFKKEHPVGSTIDGAVISIVESGAVVKLTDEIEGFVHVSQLDNKRVENVADVVKVGETYSFAIRAIEPDKRRVSLSRKDYFTASEKKDAEKYLSKQDPSSMTYSFADKLKHLEK